MRTFTESYWPADTSEPVLELTVGDLLRRAAAEVPERVALVEVAPPGTPSLSGAARTDRSWTYRGLLAEAEQCARWLLTRFAPGERITVWAPNIPEWVILQYGAAMAGLVLVTANPALREGELAYVLRQSRSAGIAYTDAFRGADMAAVVDRLRGTLPDLREAICFADWDRDVRGFPVPWLGHADALPQVSPGDPAQIQYTSGTTGFPKGALLHHRGLVTNARYISLRSRMPEGGHWVSAMPLFHTAGCAMGVLGAANMRATYVLCQLFDPALVLRALQEWRGECVFGVPTMLIAMLEHPSFRDFDASRCGLAMSGGAAVPADLIRRVEREFGCRVSTVYGQTELSPVVTQTGPADSPEDRAETVGRPLWQVEVKIVDPVTGRVLPAGEQGEICARGYQQMLEYFDLPEVTAEAVDGEGWLHTGDLGTMDARGYFRITGRLKDMIIRGGENIYPREIEDLLFEHSKIAEVAVVGVPDATWGEQVAAVLRPADPAEAPSVEELHAYCREHLAPHKTPQFWYAAESFPLTGSGKIQKFRVREMIEKNEIPELSRAEVC